MRDLSREDHHGPTPHSRCPCSYESVLTLSLYDTYLSPVTQCRSTSDYLPLRPVMTSEPPTLQPWTFPFKTVTTPRIAGTALTTLRQDCTTTRSRNAVVTFVWGLESQLGLFFQETICVCLSSIIVLSLTGYSPYKICRLPIIITIKKKLAPCNGKMGKGWTWVLSKTWGIYSQEPDPWLGGPSEQREWTIYYYLGWIRLLFRDLTNWRYQRD